jgi:hypothetical protein
MQRNARGSINSPSVEAKKTLTLVAAWVTQRILLGTRGARMRVLLPEPSPVVVVGWGEVSGTRYLVSAEWNGDDRVQGIGTEAFVGPVLTCMKLRSTPVAKTVLRLSLPPTAPI